MMASKVLIPHRCKLIPQLIYTWLVLKRIQLLKMYFLFVYTQYLDSLAVEKKKSLISGLSHRKSNLTRLSPKVYQRFTRTFFYWPFSSLPDFPPKTRTRSVSILKTTYNSAEKIGQCREKLLLTPSPLSYFNDSSGKPRLFKYTCNLIKQ